MALLTRLRELLQGSQLDWVMREVDDAIALGVLETKSLRTSRRSDGLESYVEVVAEPGYGGRGRKRAEEFLTTRRMTPKEQFTEAISAIRRATVDVDAVADASLRQLNDHDSAEAIQLPAIAEISFEPDEEETSKPVLVSAVSDRPGRGVLSEVLERLQEEVDR